MHFVKVRVASLLTEKAKEMPSPEGAFTHHGTDCDQVAILDRGTSKPAQSIPLDDGSWKIVRSNAGNSDNVEQVKRYLHRACSQ